MMAFSPLPSSPSCPFFHPSGVSVGALLDTWTLVYEFSQSMVGHILFIVQKTNGTNRTPPGECIYDAAAGSQVRVL